MITNEYTVWCEQDGCGEWHQESVGVNGTKATAINRFKSPQTGWRKKKGKWTCPKCNSKMTS